MEGKTDEGKPLPEPFASAGGNIPPTLEVRLKHGLTPEQIQDTFNDLSLFGFSYGIRSVEVSPSQDDIFYCEVDETPAVNAIEKLENLPAVASVVPGTLVSSFIPTPRP